MRRNLPLYIGKKALLFAAGGLILSAAVPAAFDGNMLYGGTLAESSPGHFVLTEEGGLN